jgi:hypothetical protein
MAVRQITKKTFQKEPIFFENFFDYDNVAIYPEINLILQRLKKSGNTSLVLFFNEICDGRQYFTTHDAKRARRLYNTNPVSLAQLSSYNSLLVVRDPQTRILSAFLDKVASGKYPGAQSIPGYSDPSQRGFEVFLDYLDDSCITKNRHFWPQSKLLYQPVESFTFAAKLETIYSDLSYILPKLGIETDLAKKMNTPHPLESKENGKITNSARRKDLISTRASNKIERLFCQDYEMISSITAKRPENLVD